MIIKAFWTYHFYRLILLMRLLMAMVTKSFSKDVDRQTRKSETDSIRVFMQLALLDCQTFEKLFKDGF